MSKTTIQFLIFFALFCDDAKNQIDKINCSKGIYSLNLTLSIFNALAI